MDFLAQYIVPFRKLGLGKHFLEFEINDDFFEIYKYEEILGANLKAKVNLNIQTKGILVEIFIFGTVKVICDRCLDEFDMEFETEGTINVEFGDNTNDEFFEGETIIVSPEQGQFNISKTLFDLIVLGLPIKKVHKDNPDGSSGCNPEMLKYIEEYSPKNTLASNIQNFELLKSKFN